MSVNNNHHGCDGGDTRQTDLTLDVLWDAIQSQDAIRLWKMYCPSEFKSWFRPNATRQFIDKLKQAANAGNAQAQSLLGFMYSDGYNVTHSSAKALKWYQRAAQAGSSIACMNLALVYTYGRCDITPQPLSALKWYLAASKCHDTTASYAYIDIADLYYYGGEGVRNREKALEYYLKAIEYNHASHTALEKFDTQLISRYILEQRKANESHLQTIEEQQAKIEHFKRKVLELKLLPGVGELYQKSKAQFEMHARNLDES